MDAAGFLTPGLTRTERAKVIVGMFTVQKARFVYLNMGTCRGGVGGLGLAPCVDYCESEFLFCPCHHHSIIVVSTRDVLEIDYLATSNSQQNPL